MRKLIFRIVIIALVLALLGPFALLFGPARLQNYVHRELIYKVIVSKLTHGLKTDTERGLALMDHVQKHLLFLPRGSEIVDEHPLNDLIRGIGICDQMTNTLITLARKAHIKGRLIFLHGYYKEPLFHSVCDLYIDGKFRIFDPYYGLIFVDEEKNIATFEDIKNKGPQLKPMIQSKSIQLLRRFELPNVKRRLFKTYETTSKPQYFRVNFRQDLKRFLLSRIIDFYYDIFGDPFFVLHQELYFRLAKTPPFLKARFKHVSFRFKSAIADYDRVITANDFKYIKDESMYFKAKAFWDIQDYHKAILEFEKLLEETPGYRRRLIVLVYLGDGYERIGNFDKAQFYYTQFKSEAGG